MNPETKYITGTWVFNLNKTPKETVIEIAKLLSQDENYRYLYVRKSGRDGFGIGFTYMYDGTKESQDKYFNENKSKWQNILKGWDINGNTTPIKGFE